MTLAANPAAGSAQRDALPSLRLPEDLRLTPQQRRGFPPLCPDLVVELAIPSDDGPRGLMALRRKMAGYRANGARLGWLLLPEEQAVEIWPAGGAPQRLERATLLDGGATGSPPAPQWSPESDAT